MKVVRRFVYIILAGLTLMSCSISNQFAANTIVEDKKTINSSIDKSLSDIDTQKIKLLIQTLANVEMFNIQNRMGEGKVLSTVEEQAHFLHILNEEEYTDLLKNTLEGYAVFEDDEVIVSKEEAEAIIKMAGAEEDKGVWQYLQNDFKHYNWDYYKRGDKFSLPFYSRESQDPYREFNDWNMVFNNDGTLSVKCKVSIKPNYDRIYSVESIIYKNEKSVFAGYTADYMMVSLDKTNETADSFIIDYGRDEYKTPSDVGQFFYEYSFSLDSAMYKMPIPLDEILKNGWVASEKMPDNENRKEIILEKEGEKIFCVLWKHKGGDWYVVGLKTQVDGKFANVDFHLFNDIKKGDKKEENKKYNFSDALYFYYYGIRTFFNENNIVEGFEIRYAPEYIDRDKRILDLCEDVTKEFVEVINENTELKTGVTYKLNKDGKEIKIQLRRLNKVEWGKFMTAIFIVGKDKTTIHSLIEDTAQFTLYTENSEDMYIEVEEDDVSVYAEPKIIYLKEYFQ